MKKRPAPGNSVHFTGKAMASRMRKVILPISALIICSLKASYEIKYHNQPVPSTLKETDTMLSLTLVANFEL
jgi:hypothetical protein